MKDYPKFKNVAELYDFIEKEAARRVQELLVKKGSPIQKKSSSC